MPGGVMCLMGYVDGLALARMSRTFAIPCGRRQGIGHHELGTEGLIKAKRLWPELKSSEFAGLEPNSALAILPVASTEQHGPHLPVMTDTAIAEGLIKTVLVRLPDDLNVLFLPTQTIGKSNEHL